MKRRYFLGSLAATSLAGQPKPGPKITRIRLSNLQGRFGKFVAMNAYDTAPKGYTYQHTLIRIETDQGVEGIAPGGFKNLTTNEYAAALKPLIGVNPFELYTMESGRIVGRKSQLAPLLATNRHLDAAFYDIIGKVTGRPAWQLIGESVRDRIPVYDSTIYFSDVWFKDRGIAAVIEECRDAVKAGFPGVKIKLGRGDKWMERKAGDDRDIAVTNAVREAIGPNVMLMADPNYGYRGHFDAAWRLMSETRLANLYWMEEIFPETVENYTLLKNKLDSAAIKTKLAAGEHMRDVQGFEPYLKPRRLMDVLQMDIRQGGFLDGAEVARVGAEAGSSACPHNWASQIGVIMCLHLAAAVRSIPMVESDRSTCDVLVADWFKFHNGAFDVPKEPGLGITINEDVYNRKNKSSEIIIS